MWDSSCGFPALFRMSLPHHRADIPPLSLLRLAGFLKHTSHTLGSQPPYLSEKNRPALPCRALTSEDDNALSRNISNNSLGNRCQSSLTCNWLSLPCPFPARIFSLLSQLHCCSAPPGPRTGSGWCRDMSRYRRCCPHPWPTTSSSRTTTKRAPER